MWEPTEWLSELLLPSPSFFSLLRRLSVSRNPYLLLITGTSTGNPALDLNAPVPRLPKETKHNEQMFRKFVLKTENPYTDTSLPFHYYNVNINILQINRLNTLPLKRKKNHPGSAKTWWTQCQAVSAVLKGKKDT